MMFTIQLLFFFICRLQHMCLEILDTYDEDELYQMYKRFGKALKESHLCAKYCKGPKRKTEL